MSEGKCVVCGRDSAIPVIGVCGECLRFAGDAFSMVTESARSGSVPLDAIDWVSLATGAVRIASRSDEVTDGTDQVLEIVENATRVADVLTTLYEEITVAVGGGEADTDRIADAINDGVSALFGNDGASRLVQAGIRASLDLLAGDEPIEILRGVLKEVLPGWMLTDLWLDEVFAPPEPPTPPVPVYEHQFVTTGLHAWTPLPDGAAEMSMRCRACGTIASRSDLMEKAGENCPDADPEVCSICEEKRSDHGGHVPDEALTRIDALAEQYLGEYRAALEQDPESAGRAASQAIGSYFDRLGEVLDSIDDKQAEGWLPEHATDSFLSTVERMEDATGGSDGGYEEAKAAWIDRSMGKLEYPYAAMAPAGIDPMDEAMWSSCTPGDPMILNLVVRHLPNHPISLDHAQSVQPLERPAALGGVVDSAVAEFKESGRSFASERGLPIWM